MMNKSYQKYSFAALVALSAFASCEDPDVDPINEEELITDVILTLTNGSNSIELKYSDPDGDGPDAPVITSPALSPGTEYVGTLEFKNTLENPVEDITEEIKEEDEEHQIFYSTTASITVAYDDMDSENNPIGLKTTMTTGSSGTGNLRIVLKHEPNKSASGVSAGDMTNAGGETDIDVTFPITIQTPIIAE